MNVLRRNNVWIGLAALLLSANVLAAESWNEAAEPFEMQPGVIVHPGRDSTFLMKPGGGLEEIALRTGRVLWETAEADKPLAASDDMLLAQVDTDSGVFELVLFDRTAPVAVPRRARVELPSGVQALIDEQRQKTFSTTSRVDGNHVYVIWSFQERSKVKRPVQPPPPPKEQRGAFRIDLGSAEIDIVPVESVPTDPALRLAEAVTKTAGPSEHRSAAMRTGDVVAVTNVTRGNNVQAVVTVERWMADTGQRMADLELFRGEVRSQWTSVDGRHVLLGRSSGQDDLDNAYLWTVYSADTGEESGRRFDKIAGSPFFVAHDSALVYETAPWGYRDGATWHDMPRSLQSVELRTRTKNWSHEIRDTAYRGLEVPTR